MFTNASPENSYAESEALYIGVVVLAVSPTSQC